MDVLSKKSEDLMDYSLESRHVAGALKIRLNTRRLLEQISVLIHVGRYYSDSVKASGAGGAAVPPKRLLQAPRSSAGRQYRLISDTATWLQNRLFSGPPAAASRLSRPPSITCPYRPPSSGKFDEKSGLTGDLPERPRAPRCSRPL